MLARVLVRAVVRRSQEGQINREQQLVSLVEGSREASLHSREEGSFNKVEGLVHNKEEVPSNKVEVSYNKAVLSNKAAAAEAFHRKEGSHQEVLVG